MWSSPENYGLLGNICRYSDLESRMKDELMNVKIKYTEQSQLVAELKQEISRLETKVRILEFTIMRGFSL